MRYGYRLGCKNGMPHDLHITHQNDNVRCEVCWICNKRFRWGKGYKGRIQNEAYLRDHVRNYCQRNGATKRVYNRIYKPELMTIKI